MVISEIFHSIQGEGPTTGRPAVFVRLGMCNLQCNFCDTPYTWKPGQEDYSDEANERIVEEIAKLLIAHPGTKTAMSGNNTYSVRLRDYAKTIYKYVVGTKEHCEEALREIERQKLPRDRCFFMVLGTTAEEMLQRSPTIAEVCKKEGITLCIRLQSVLWNSARGV